MARRSGPPAASPGSHLLWIEDDAALRRIYRPLLEAEGYLVSEAPDATQARALVQTAVPDLVLLDLMLPPSGLPAEGLALMQDLLALQPPPKIVVLTGSGGKNIALEAVGRGAHDFLKKPIDPDVLLVVLGRAAAMVALEKELGDLRKQLEARNPKGSMVGRSPVFLAAVELADKVAPTDLPVTISGEHGTGKELVARRIHTAGRRAEGPFIPINCGALPPALLESTLFGHTRGAFTGAIRARAGLFQEAHGGTLFLDEVGELEPQTQVRLLRALESGEILPVGADRPFQVDVRIVSATNRNLSELVREGRFRDDLFWRLRGVEIHLPPLRDRGEDIIILAHHFLRLTTPRLGRRIQLSTEAETALRHHRWPGNLRELRHTMQRATVMAGERRAIQAADLGLQAPEHPPDGATLAEQVMALERRAIIAALGTVGGNRTRAAQHLGLSRQGLLNKMNRYGIIPPGPR